MLTRLKSLSKRFAKSHSGSIILVGVGSSSLGAGCLGGVGVGLTTILARVTAVPAAFWAAHWYHPPWDSTALWTVNTEMPASRSVAISASCTGRPS